MIMVNITKKISPVTRQKYTKSAIAKQAEAERLRQLSKQSPSKSEFIILCALGKPDNQSVFSKYNSDSPYMQKYYGMSKTINLFL